MVGPSPTMMGVAVFVLQLTPADFNDRCICLGPQIAAVLESLIELPELSKVTWYAASVDPIEAPEVREALQNYESNGPRPIADMATFVPLVRGAGQFLDGVFFSVPLGQIPVVAVKLLTADGPVEKLVANSVVEVCAFDTSLIEIGADLPIIVQSIQGRFGGKTLQLPIHE